MVMKTVYPLETKNETRLRALVVGSAMAVLIVSATSGSAGAAEILPGSDPQILTQGNELPQGGFVASRMASNLINPLSLGPNDLPPENGPGLDVSDPGQGGDDPIRQVDSSAVPEPGILGLFGAGLVALGLFRRRRG